MFSASTYLAESSLDLERAESDVVRTLPGEKFLVYLPQDIFYQQKIALENAIMLAYYLNRSLIIPPVHLGSIIEWAPFDTLYPQVTSKSKQAKKHCSEVMLRDLPSECLSYTSWTRLPWSYLFDLTKIQDYVRIYEESDLSFEHMSRYGVAKEDIQVFKEEARYEYKFADNSALHNNSKGHFQSLLHVSALQAYDQKLLYLHSMNGRGRVQTSHPNNYQVFQEMLKSYVWNNTVILDVANTVVDMLGGSGNYFGVEIPTLGLEFSEKIPENIESILTTLEEELINKNCACSPILYLSTDSVNPRSHIDLAPLFRRYPCTFTLQDFHQQFATLSSQVNVDDQVNLAQYIAPMVETEIVSRGSLVATIRNSGQGMFAGLLHDIYFHKKSKVYKKLDFSTV
ncbi:hypothetical protein K493DRAFT_345194 [Basidiobolus meristosporus CBS 931.73]|uniref:Uncharacterized protein n=1 Tax=Basidiobolus meristosporus CBS 931.73 TaxID=1314790 RepID=A0A1Y1Z489_9FUNG|nr:hypothetical protein K493DRAFT_345194 [Basidiobolus meristosporus CBS 931.73]|eukprot:ORY05088.1 hypothetical protein K493DRAFT_345194 [Basidiobolus meristosporus CBS 931.73]